MSREFQVNELAQEFGVHRNTIRNWIRSGTLPAQKSPGRRYVVKLDDYKKLCEKFGKTPRLSDSDARPAEPAASPKPRTNQHHPLLLRDGNNRPHTGHGLIDTCLGCGSCANACPLSGVDGLDPGKIIRMAFLGMESELIAADWPWKCTMCGKCEQSCPMGIEITRLIFDIRSKRERTEVPGSLHKGVLTHLKRGNNMGIPQKDFTTIATLVGEKLASGPCPGFTTPLDIHGARLLVTVNSRDPFVQPAAMQWWWKILYAADESWTIASENWDGVNWGLYTGDEQAMKTLTGRMVDNMERLGCKALLLPD